MNKKGTTLSPVNKFKETEKNIYHKGSKSVKGGARAVSSISRKIFSRGRQRYTVMLIPHDEKKPFNFQVSLFAILFLGVFFSLIIGGVILYSTEITGTSQILADKTIDLENAEKNLDLIRREIRDLKNSAKGFQDSLSRTLAVLGVEDAQSKQQGAVLGDLSSFLGIKELDPGSLSEVADLQNLTKYLEDSTKPLGEIGEVLNTQKDLLVDIPTLWPVARNKGIVTQKFGAAIHPFTGKWYLHKGIDIGYTRGTELLATANGTVVDVKFESRGYGHNVIIRHKYGFSTRYAHMDKAYVYKGQEVHRGQVIGILGNSGLSTGPHIHYEIRMGTQVLDPSEYMNISSTILDN